MKFLLGLICLGLAHAMHQQDLIPKQGHHVHHFHIRPTSPIPLGLENAMNQTMELELRAGEVSIFLDLVLKIHQWGKDSKIITEFDDQGNVKKTLPLFHRAYKGKAFVQHGDEDSGETGDVSVTFFADKRATVLVVTSHDIYSIDLNEFRDVRMPMKGKDHGHGMHMIRHSEMDYGANDAEEHTNDPVRRRLRKFFMARPGARKLQQLIPFDNCFTGFANMQRAIKMGLVSDPAYYQLKAGNTNYGGSNDGLVANAMIAEMNKVSEMVYSKQLRVWLLSGTIITGRAAAGLPTGTLGCGADGSSRLTTFRQWRQSYEQQNQDTNALWHLLTNCHPPPGTVGIAYIGVICSKSYGVGWTNNVRSSTWLTLAHEIGHNFNSPHSFDNGQGRTGGIMDYGDGCYPAPAPTRARPCVHAFNPLRKNDICSGITKSLTSTSRFNIAPNLCWTTYGTVTTPRPTTPQPTTKQPTRRPTSTPRPTTRQPTPRPTNRPTTPQPTNRPTTPEPTNTPRPTRRPTTTTTQQPTNRPTRRPTTPQPTRNPTDKPTSQQPVTVITFVWERKGNEYEPCSATCGSGTEVAKYQCVKVTELRGSTTPPTKTTVADSQCDPLTKPTTPTRACTRPACPTPSCGNGVVDNGEVCDTKTNNCCAAGCKSFKQTVQCLARNKLIDATFQSCLNDVQRSNCFVYIFQGEYFNKFRRVPRRRGSFLSPAWNGARKHKGIVQTRWNEVTAVAGGQNGQIYVFNNFDFLHIDFSNEAKGRLLKTDSVANLWTQDNPMPAKFKSCGSVTAAEVYYEEWLMMFCESYFTFANLVSPSNSVEWVWPAKFFRQGLKPGQSINAVYRDKPSGAIRTFVGDVQQSYAAANMVEQGSMNETVQGVGTPTQNSCSDSNCVTCGAEGGCAQCTSGYVVQVEQCVPELTLLYLTFEKNNQKNDKFYLRGAMSPATYVTDQGNNADSAMVFTTSTTVAARAPLLSGKKVDTFRVEIWYKPNTVDKNQTLVTIDGRFTIKFTNVDSTTMKTFVKLDDLWFDCYVHKPLTLNKWNFVVVELSGNQIITYVNEFTHNRGFSVVSSDRTSGGPTVGLTFEDVVIGASSGGLNGAVDSFVIKEVPISSPATNLNQEDNSNSKNAWIMPVAIVGAILGFCLIAGLIFLCYRRGVCGGKETDHSNDAQTAFLAASGQDTNYVRMT